MISVKFLAAGLAFCVLGTGCVSREFNNKSNFEEIGSDIFGTDLRQGEFILTFDDGPGERTVELARYLAQEGISATFFVQGSHAAADKGTLKILKELGHIVGNHTYNHPDLFTCPQSPADEVRQTDAVIAPYITDNIFVFRAPYGNCDGAVAKIINDGGLRKYVGPFYWDVGGARNKRYSADWDCWAHGDSPTLCGEGYLNEMSDRGRGIVLAHDIHADTIDMMKWLIPKAKEKGFKFVRIDASPSIAAKIRAAGSGKSGGGSGGTKDDTVCSEKTYDARICTHVAQFPVYNKDGREIGKANPGEPVCKTGKKSGERVSAYFLFAPAGEAYLPADKICACDVPKLQVCIKSGGEQFKVGECRAKHCK